MRPSAPATAAFELFSLQPEQPPLFGAFGFGGGDAKGPPGGGSGPDGGGGGGDAVSDVGGGPGGTSFGGVEPTGGGLRGSTPRTTPPLDGLAPSFAPDARQTPAWKQVFPSTHCPCLHTSL